VDQFFYLLTGTFCLLHCRKESKKPNENKGKFYYACPKIKGPRCSFYKWEHEIFKHSMLNQKDRVIEGMPKRKRMKEGLLEGSVLCDIVKYV